MTARVCESIRYAISEPCDGPADHDVVYASATGRELDRGPACALHGAAEVARHKAAGGIAVVHLEHAPRVVTP